MSPVMRDLQTDQSPLDFPVLVEQVSWIGSLVGIGSVMGNLLAGTLMDRIGRKLVLFGIAIPYMVYRGIDSSYIKLIAKIVKLLTDLLVPNLLCPECGVPLRGPSNGRNDRRGLLRRPSDLH